MELFGFMFFLLGSPDCMWSQCGQKLYRWTWEQGYSDSVIDTSILFLGQRYTVYIGLVAIKYSCPPDVTLS